MISFCWRLLFQITQRPLLGQQREFMAWGWAESAVSCANICQILATLFKICVNSCQVIFSSISSVSLRLYFELEITSMNSERPDRAWRPAELVTQYLRIVRVSYRVSCRFSWTVFALHGYKSERCLWIWDFRTSLTAPCKLLPNVLRIRNSGKWTF